MKLLDAALNIVTFGFYSFRKSQKLETELKSLRDQSIAGGAFNSAQGAVKVIQAGKAPANQKQNVNTLRLMAENSAVLRAAIDSYRETISKAEPIIRPFDKFRPMNDTVKEALEALIAEPNRKQDSFSQLIGGFVEDHLVVGHAGLGINLTRDLTPYELLPMDAARIGFVPNWDGSPDKPRYVMQAVERDKDAKPLYSIQAMVVVNRLRTYDLLGLSHVEVLETAIKAIFAGDETLANQILNGVANGALYLGEHSNQNQVDEVSERIENVKRPFLVLGNTKEPKYIPFNATPDQMKYLDTQTWFVRYVAATFKLPMAMLGQTVDTSRANTDSMLGQSQEGMGAVLYDIREAFNRQIVSLFGSVKKHNCYFDYPVMNQRDEVKQTDINSKQLNNQAWVSINEARIAQGLEPLELDIANEILLNTSGGLMPLTVLNQAFADKLNSDNFPQIRRLLSGEIES